MSVGLGSARGGSRPPFLFAFRNSFPMRWVWLTLLAISPFLPLNLAHTVDPCQSDAIELLQDRGMEKTLLALLKRTEREVWVGIFMFKVGDHPGSAPGRLLKELIRLHRSGVQVHVLLERPEDPSSDLARNNLRTARRLSAEGIDVVLDHADRRSHMKVVVVDRR